MKTIKDLTPEIKAKIQSYKDKAIKNLYNGVEYNNWQRKDTVKYIEYVYQLTKRPNKPVVIVADDPLQYRQFYNLLFNSNVKAIKLRKLISAIYSIKNKKKLEISENLNTELDTKFYVKLNTEFYVKLNTELDSELDSKLGRELDSELRHELSTELGTELGTELDRELRNELSKELHNELNTEFYVKLYTELGTELDNELHNELNTELNRELDNELYNELDNELCNELNTELDNELHNELCNELNTELDNELHNELYNELNTELNRELDSELYNELCKELNTELDRELDREINKSAKSHWLPIANEYARVYLMWYKFIKDEFKIETKKEKELDWLYENVNQANIAKCFFTEKVVLVLRMPESITRNSQFISNVNGAAIFYPNFKMYYVNGLRISKELFTSLSNQQYTFNEWTKEPNEEVKSAVLGFYQEKFGDEFIFRFLSENLKEVSTYVDKKEEKYLEGTTKGMNIGVYTLFKGVVNQIEIAYVRCYCPSTDRMFFLGVDPKNNNAKDAIASLYTIPRKVVNEIIRIQRQGEVFSTNFTEKGLEVIKTMSKEDVADIVSVSGNDYFRLLKYEY